jgi:predicted lipid-binding transport protein (Tim44 family)
MYVEVSFMRSRTLFVVIGLALGITVLSEAGDAWARARGGGGGSGRGSRSYSAPARPAPASPDMPSSPSRSLNQPGAPVSPARPGGMFGGLMGGLAGFAIGGLLGSMLFGGMGLGSGLGIGLMDILLIGGGIALLVMFLRRRRAAEQPAYSRVGEPQPAYAGMGSTYRTAEPERPMGGGGAATMEAPQVDEIDRGLGHMRQMDPTLNPDALVAAARQTFTDVQAAVSTKDLARVRERVTPELYGELQQQVDEMRAARRTNRVERAQIRQSQITEAWQESGRDYVTVCLAGSIIDYTVDDATGAVVGGSATQPESFEEFWTFARPVGPNAWRLSAIQTA